MRYYKNRLKRIFAGVLASVMVLGAVEVPSTKVYAAEEDKTMLDISKGIIEFDDESIKVAGVSQEYDSDGYIITGTTTSNKIIVHGGTHDITLDNVDIQLSGNGGPQPFYIDNEASVNLNLSGDNVLVAGANCAGVQVRPEASVIISGEGSLKVTGGYQSAAIGGGNACAGGRVTINSGEITAQGGDYGAGIGGGFDYNYNDYGGNAVGPIRINGGTVIALGGYEAAGIGGGFDGPGGDVIITGGNVKAVGDPISIAENIGQGAYGDESGTLTDGSDINAKDLELVKLIVRGAGAGENIVVESLDEDYLKNAKLIDGELWLWLPEDFDYYEINSLTIGDAKFEGTVWNGGKNIFAPAGEAEHSPDITLTNSLLLFETTKGQYYMMGDECRKYTGLLSVKGTEDTTHTISVENGTPSILLENVNIDVRTTENKCALAIENEAKVTLYPEGENKLMSGKNCAGIQVDPSAEVKFSTWGTEGSLQACGGMNGAGIGAGGNGACGTVTITAGNITATGGTNGAGIGGGDGTSCGTVTITAGNITATGGTNGAGIGGGYGSNAGVIKISGGTIIAERGSGSVGAYGIGTGEAGTLGSVVISGGNIKTSSISGTPKSSEWTFSAKPVSLFTITIEGLEKSVPVSGIEGIGYYDFEDVTTLDTNRLYLYLPDDVQRVTQLNANIQNMEYSTANGGELDYDKRKATLRTDWSYETVGDVVVSGRKGNNGWYVDDVVITAPEGYYIGTDPSDIRDKKIVIKQDMDGEFAYYLQEIYTGNVTEEKKIHIKRDSVEPEAKIVIGKDSFSTICDSITYNRFYKDKVEVSVQSNDGENQSGVALVEYQKVKKNYVYDKNTGWIAKDKVTVEGREQFVIYARVTDQAGNTTIVSTDGIVLYEDSVLDKNSITYTMGSGKNASIGLTWNDNEIKSIQLGDTVLVKGKDYTIEGRTITFYNSCLGKLETGSYKISFTYKPLGLVTDKIILANTIDLKVVNKLISDVSFDLVTPKAGVALQKSILDGKDYTGTVLWNCSGETFGYNTAYTAIVTLIPNENCAFAEGIQIADSTVNYNADGSITIAKKFKETRKAVLTSLTPPTIRKFDSYYASAEEALNNLNKNVNTVVITAEDGAALLPVDWSFEGNYIATPGESNTFTWKADTSAYSLNATLITEGTVQIENTNVEGVVVKSKDTEIVYDGEVYDVGDLFEISDHTGKETYTLKELSGQGELEDADLTITKTGTFEITVQIEADGKYNATTATAVLTVKKGEGNAEVEMEDCVYGTVGLEPSISSEDYDVTKAKVVYTSADGKGYNSKEFPANIGEYLVTVTFPGNDLYNSTQVDTTFAIEPKDIEGAVITLGKKLVFTGSKQKQTVASVIVDGKVLNAEDYIVTDNEAIDTGEEYTLTVTGCGNYTGSETLDFVIEKVEAPIIPDVSRSYLYTVGSRGKIITVNIAELLPKDRGETIYTVTGDVKGYVMDPFVEDDGRLTYEVDAAYSADTTSIVVTAITQKYKDISIRVQIILTTNAGSQEVFGEPKAGASLKDSKKQAIYKVTRAATANRTVEYVKPVKKTASKVTIPETIKVDGITYKVTSIAKNAFRNHKKLKQVTIGKNVKSIGAHAFYNCKKLKTVTLKTSNLTKKTVGAKAFKGIRDDVSIKAPKGKQKSYEKLLNSKGVSTKAKFK